MSRPRLVFALAVALAGVSCQAQREWREIRTGPVPFEDAWNAVVETAAVDQMRPDAAETDRGLRVLTTRWRQRAMPFGGSVRRRLHAEFEPAEEGDGWLVRFYVEKQNMPTVSGGFHPVEDDWSDAGQDLGMEQLILSKLQFRFRGGLGDLGPAPEEKLGRRLP